MAGKAYRGQYDQFPGDADTLSKFYGDRYARSMREAFGPYARLDVAPDRPSSASAIIVAVVAVALLLALAL